MGCLEGNAMRYAIIVLALLGVLASPRPAAAGSAKFISELCQKNRTTASLHVHRTLLG